jgi:UDPglucose--hexose-1-phosphate uridylyltransferase
LAALHGAVGDAPYNVVIRTAPPNRSAGEFHWHVDVLPRTTLVAGFEEGTGILVNSTPPEQAAVALRRSATG